jgi:hypothetical protein
LRFLKVEVGSDMAEDGLRAVADEGAEEVVTARKGNVAGDCVFGVSADIGARQTQSSTPASLWFLAHRLREFEVEGTPYNC